MGWGGIDGVKVDKQEAERIKNEAKARAIALAKTYHRCFTTEDGKAVLADLTKVFIMDNKTPLEATNVNFESAYHNGEANVVKSIIGQFQRAETL